MFSIVYRFHTKCDDIGTKVWMQYVIQTQILWENLVRKDISSDMSTIHYINHTVCCFPTVYCSVEELLLRHIEKPFTKQNIIYIYIILYSDTRKVTNLIFVTSICWKGKISYYSIYKYWLSTMEEKNVFICKFGTLV